MNTKTMEGLIGAGTNIELVNTPMRVYKEARLKGDTATMERAMGYVNEFEEKAYECKDIADEGMKEDAKEAREKAESELEETIQKRRQEREEFEEKLEQKHKEKTAVQDSENNSSEYVNADMDTLVLSDEGKILLENSEINNDIQSKNIDLDNADSDSKRLGVLTYTKSSEECRTELRASVSIRI